MNETTSLTVVRYRTKDGLPTCAANFETGEVCMFYATQRFGCSETCLFSDKSDRIWQSMARRDQGRGTLIPLATCPVWQEVKV